MDDHQEVSEVDGSIAVFPKPAEGSGLELLSFRGAQDLLAQFCKLLRTQKSIGAILLEVSVVVLKGGDVLAGGRGHLALKVRAVTLFVPHRELTG